MVKAIAYLMAVMLLIGLVFYLIVFLVAVAVLIALVRGTVSVIRAARRSKLEGRRREAVAREAAARAADPLWEFRPALTAAADGCLLAAPCTEVLIACDRCMPVLRRRDQLLWQDVSRRVA